MGNYGDAIILGVILLLIAFLLQSMSDMLHKNWEGGENI
jgi:ABC-type tungstate transport system substrate-binding protein